MYTSWRNHVLLKHFRPAKQRHIYTSWRNCFDQTFSSLQCNATHCEELIFCSNIFGLANYTIHLEELMFCSNIFGLANYTIHLEEIMFCSNISSLASWRNHVLLKYFRSCNSTLYIVEKKKMFCSNISSLATWRNHVLLKHFLPCKVALYIVKESCFAETFPPLEIYTLSCVVCRRWTSRVCFSQIFPAWQCIVILCAVEEVLCFPQTNTFALHRVLFCLSQMNRLFALVLGVLLAAGITIITVYTGYIPASVNIVLAEQYEAIR